MFNTFLCGPGRRRRCQFPFWTSPTSSSRMRACLTAAASRALTTWEPASAICQTTAWRMRRAGPWSWMLSDELYELRMAYTLPAYRRAGRLLALSLALMRRMSSVGLPVYCHVDRQNQATINAVTSLGFSACPSMENISVLLICKDRVWVVQSNANKVCWMIETTLEKCCFIVKVENVTITLLVLWFLFPHSTQGKLRFRQFSPFLTENCK